MKPGLSIGDVQERSLQVTPDAIAALDQKAIHPLYGTAAMISHMEWVARQHLLPYLDPGEEGVGCHVDVRHLYPTPVGAWVRVIARVSQLTATQITCDVETWHGDFKVGEGIIVQALVNPQQLYQKAQQSLTQTVLAKPNAMLNAQAILSSSTSEEFFLELLGWESLYPCTVYDEWLQVRLCLQTEERSITITGPFLLRMEVLALYEGLKALLNQTQAALTLSFLEPVLSLSALVTDAGQWSILIALKDPQEAVLEASLTCTREQMGSFCLQLAETLECFPSQV